MALFGKKTKTDDKKIASAKPAKAAAVKAKPVKAAKAVAVKSSAAPSVSAGSAGAIIRPRLTEKSGLLSQMGVYTFEVTEDATKSSVSRAIAALYKVTPVKVAMIRLPARRVFVKGRHGTVSSVRKALVTVKKGDKIDFV
jgi:large subunit ribosomal protein L23